MATIQWLTHTYGWRYNNATVPASSLELANQSPKAVTARPRSERRTRDASSARKSEPVGAKWLLPKGFLEGGLCRLNGAAVMLVRRYHGQPTACCTMMRKKVTMGESSVSSSSRATSKNKLDAYSVRRGGT